MRRVLGIAGMLMLATTEVVEVLRKNQKPAEVTAGIISEALYFPISALVASSILS